MKPKVLLFVTYLLFINGTATVCAQSGDSTIVKEGNLVYLKVGNTLEKFGKEELKGKSYEQISFEFTTERYEQVYKPLYRSVFSKDRCEELLDGKIICFIIYSPVDDKILKIRFVLHSKEKRDIPVTLKELDELEQKLKAVPNLIKFSHSGKIVDHGETISLFVRFRNLYE
jgi:hypothetical protein